MQKVLIGLLLLGCSTLAMAQKRKLPPNVSSFSDNEYAPKLAADGRTIIYLSDNTMSGNPELFISYSVGGNNWKPGKSIDIRNQDMIPFGAYNLSYDGQQLIYATKKGPKIGGYDIQFQQKEGSTWGALINPGKPLNSALNEMDPTLSADGKTLYFSRCETLDPNTGNCKLFTAKYLGNNYWKEPQEVQLDLASTSFVNPVILPDNKTLYFAALNSSGNYDFYMSRLEDDSWSKPDPMDFLNTDAHDRYLGVTALGDVVYIHEQDERSYDLYMVKVPEEFQPAKVYYLEGTVTNLPAKALVRATDVVTGVELARLILDPEEKTFGIYLPEGHQVDFSIQTNEPGFGYYNEFFDLEAMGSSKKVVKDFTLPTLKADEQYPVSIAFKEQSVDFTAGAEEEFARLIALMKQNRSFLFNLEVYQQSITESELYTDSLPEIRYDTLATEAAVTSEEDGTVAEQVSEEEIVTIYHNDLTQKRANAIKAYLLGKGVPESMFSTSGLGENFELDYLESGKAVDHKVIVRLE
ncbi:PD40 domain-containing protein [Marivirga sp. S37H4]|uniref:PD40 domain-containing protein n=1 Tax=Marivirga aurantiaca TaxID=2802615 RepID=A0A934WZG2_9BACT|nr:PD40 domain-containing protein [Marivirga aurantiaca]MBK6266058.1 PD40 domain-containing protein [Marivirga aurantiaca]